MWMKNQIWLICLLALNRIVSIYRCLGKNDISHLCGLEKYSLLRKLDLSNNRLTSLVGIGMHINPHDLITCSSAFKKTRSTLFVSERVAGHLRTRRTLNASESEGTRSFMESDIVNHIGSIYRSCAHIGPPRKPCL